jgi:hypothetical protein
MKSLMRQSRENVRKNRRMFRQPVNEFEGPWRNEASANEDNCEIPGKHAKRLHERHHPRA